MNRKDGKLVKDIDGLHNILVCLKPNRCDSDVYINFKIDVTNLVKFVNKHKNDSENKLTYFHVFCTALAKLFYEKPKLNRFICDKNTYVRNDVIISFIAKIDFTDKSEEVMININFDKDDNVYSVRDKISNRVNKVRDKKNENNKENTNNAVDKIGKLPRIIRVPLVGIYKWLDKKGFLPLSLMKDNIYYSSAIVSNLGNFGIGSIYHNLTDFGTSSMLITIGQIHKDKMIDKDGKEYICDVCDFGVNCDERIADGFYFASACKLFASILENPEVLEDAISEKYKEQ